jgi:hypothetical protein
MVKKQIGLEKYAAVYKIFSGEKGTGSIKVGDCLNRCFSKMLAGPKAISNL